MTTQPETILEHDARGWLKCKLGHEWLVPEPIRSTGNPAAIDAEARRRLAAVADEGGRNR